MVRSNSLITAQQKYYAKNREKCIAAMMSWRDRNKEHCRKYSREYYKKRKLECGGVRVKNKKEITGFSKVELDEPITLKFD